MDTSFGIFQRPPLLDTDMYSLAWKVSHIPPSGNHQVSWQTNYNFYSTPIGQIRFGTVVSPTHSVPAHLQGANEITLESNMMLNNPRYGQPGYTIQVSGQVPPYQCGVGIGLSNSCLFVSPAVPNSSVVYPEPGNQYYVAHGNFRQGEVINFQELAGNAAIIDFEGAGTTVNVTLNETGSWTVQ